MKKLTQIILSVSLLTALSAQAQVEFGEMGWGGTGCAAAEGEKPSLRIANGVGRVLYNDFSVTSGSRDALINRQACSIRLPVSVAADYQVGLTLSNVVGGIMQARKVQSSVQANLSVVGAQETSSLQKSWTTKINSNYELSDSQQAETVWSACGRDAILRIDANILSSRSKTSAKASLAIDELSFEFAVRRCH